MTGAVARRAVSASQGANDIDLLIADSLRRRDEPLHDPPGWVAFHREAFAPQSHEVTELLAPADTDVRALQLTTLVDVLRSDVPALANDLTRTVADAADRVQGLREPFIRPTYAADVAHHSAMASSGARQARVIAAVTRFMASRRIIEIGTAYGLGTLTLAHVCGPEGHVITAERSEPQLSVARDTLADQGNVTLLAGIAADETAEITDALGGASDLLFHDGAHSREAYVEDFAAYEPLLGPGAAVLFDDIDWSDDRFHPDAQTYAGWREVAGHGRVVAACEIDHTWGLLLLR